MSHCAINITLTWPKVQNRRARGGAGNKAIWCTYRLQQIEICHSDLKLPDNTRLSLQPPAESNNALPWARRRAQIDAAAILSNASRRFDVGLEYTSHCSSRPAFRFRPFRKLRVWSHVIMRSDHRVL
jgi:hypothetical protein